MPGNSNSVLIDSLPFDVLSEDLLSQLLIPLNIRLNKLSFSNKNKAEEIKSIFKKNNNDNLSTKLDDDLNDFLISFENSCNELATVVNVLNDLVIACNHSEFNTYLIIALYIIKNTDIETAAKIGEQLAKKLKPEQAWFFYIKISKDAPHDRATNDSVAAFALEFSREILNIDIETKEEFQRMLYPHFWVATEVLLADQLLQNIFLSHRSNQSKDKLIFRNTADYLVDHCCKEYLYSLVQQYVKAPESSAGVIASYNATFRYALQREEKTKHLDKQSDNDFVSIPSSKTKVSRQVMSIYNGMLVMRRIPDTIKKFSKELKLELKNKGMPNDNNNSVESFIYKHIPNIQQELSASLARLTHNSLFLLLFQRKTASVKSYTLPTESSSIIDSFKKAKNILTEIHVILEDNVKNNIKDNIYTLLESNEALAYLLHEPFFRFLLRVLFMDHELQQLNNPNALFSDYVEATLMTVFVTPTHTLVAESNNTKMKFLSNSNLSSNKNEISIFVSTNHFLKQKIILLTSDFKITDEKIKKLNIICNDSMHAKLITYQGFHDFYTDFLFALAGFYNEKLWPNHKNTNQALSIYKMEIYNLINKKEELINLKTINAIIYFLYHYVDQLPLKDNENILRLLIFLAIESHTKVDLFEKIISIVNKGDKVYKNKLLNCYNHNGEVLSAFAARISRSTTIDSANYLTNYIVENHLFIRSKPASRVSKISSYEVLLGAPSFAVEPRPRSQSEGTALKSDEATNKNKSYTTTELQK